MEMTDKQFTVVLDMICTIIILSDTPQKAVEKIRAIYEK